MNGYYLAHFTDSDLRRIRPRDDMQAALEIQGGVIPRDGPAWTFHGGGEVLAILGYSRLGAAKARGWLLASDMTPRQWARLIQLAPLILNKMRGWGTVKTLGALADARLPGARRVLERLGFDWTGDEDGDALMTLELR